MTERRSALTKLIWACGGYANAPNSDARKYEIIDLQELKYLSLELEEGWIMECIFLQVLGVTRT